MRETKASLDDLAVFGGQPAFDRRLHVGFPNVGNKLSILGRVSDLLDRGWLSNDGPFVQEFEKQVAEMLGVGHCIALCNGTVGLEILARATGLSGEVILPSFTFAATAHALQWLGIKPVFCDIDPKTHNLDPNRVEDAITPRTTGIIGVHLWGRPCEVSALEGIARRHDLALLFDAAQAFGCSYRGRMIGNFGAGEVLSFHATKFLNTFEGGAIVTNDGELAARARLMRNFGFIDYDCVVSVGINGKMSEVCAAMGLTSLESLNEFISVNRRNYEQYRKQLSGLPGISVMTYDETEKANYQYVVLEIDEATIQISRDELQEILWAENILARRYFYPGCHRMEPYKSLQPDAVTWLSNTERVADRVLCLPTGTSVDPTAVSIICETLRFICSAGAELRKNLRVEGSRATI